MSNAVVNCCRALSTIEQRRQSFELIVENDESIGQLLPLAISQETAYQVRLVYDGDEELRFVSEIAPGLFLLDYQLPGVNFFLSEARP